MNKHIGSSFDDFLQSEDLLQECESTAAKRVFVYQLEEELKKQQLSKADLAKKMGTSRSAISRLLDPSSPSTLRSLILAARSIGKQVSIKLV